MAEENSPAVERLSSYENKCPLHLAGVARAVNLTTLTYLFLAFGSKADSLLKIRNPLEFLQRLFGHRAFYNGLPSGAHCQVKSVQCLLGTSRLRVNQCGVIVQPFRLEGLVSG